jgi:hypothetical protein
MFHATLDRRRFLADLGIGAAALPFALNLPSLGFATESPRRQRLIVMFSPNGIVPSTFWPDETGEQFQLKSSMAPLGDFRDQLLVVRGLCDKVKGDGDNHMRGMGCLLTGIELYPGNIQGGSHTPAGWASGLSIDQEIKRHLQSQPSTATRFGSLEFGVMVPDRADTWTRMVYAGPNKPVTPIDDPYQMFGKLYGDKQDNELLGSVLDTVHEDLKRLSAKIGAKDRQILEEHATFVRDMEKELKAAGPLTSAHALPDLEPGVKAENDNIPTISRMQIDLLVNSFSADFTRIATLQYTNSVGQARMRWLGVEEGHHELSHEPDSNEAAQSKLTKINTWFAEQLAYLAKRLRETPDPQGGTLLDNTLIVWTNELGQGNSHTLDNIPFVLLGSAPGFKTGRSLKLDKVSHNRLLISLAHAFDHRIEKFGNPDFCAGGPISELG